MRCSFRAVVRNLSGTVDRWRQQGGRRGGWFCVCAAGANAASPARPTPPWPSSQQAVAAWHQAADQELGTVALEQTLKVQGAILQATLQISIAQLLL